MFPTGWALTRFVRDRRAAATALTAALLTVMSLAGIAFAGDHMWLVYQRDLLKAATDAAGIAATRALTTLSSSLTDAQVKAALQPIAERYILANIPAGSRDRVANSLTVDLTPNRSAGTVDVSASADLGGAVFGSWLWGTVVSETRVGSRTERVESITEVVLALDATDSMMHTLRGYAGNHMDAAQDAALALVDILTDGTGNSVAFGLVPWHDQVTLNRKTRKRWKRKGWAVYPKQVSYPRFGGTHAVPQPQPEPWHGCIEPRSTSGTNPLGLSVVPPTKAKPFTMKFFSATSFGESSVADRISFECNPALLSPGALDCYAGCVQDEKKCGTAEDISVSWSPSPGVPEITLSVRLNHIRPQELCRPAESTAFNATVSDVAKKFSPVLPLTTNVSKIKSAIRDLEGTGSATYSAVGLLWGHRLLAPQWRSRWGDPVHPVKLSQYPSAQKALVLLTDGRDTYPRYTAAKREEHRQIACQAAKDAGIKVFVVGIGSRHDRQSLTQCSSQADDPSGQYVFIHGSDIAENLKNTFEQIGRQLIRFRRVA